MSRGDDFGGGARVLEGLGPALAASPDILLHRLDPVHEAGHLVRLTERGYGDAAFLDDSILGPQTPGLWARLDEIAGLTASLPEHCDFIFHIGHVGSTLMSRLLGAFTGVLSLREPMPLPLLAQLHGHLHRPESLWSPERFEAVLSLCLKLWSRTYRPDQTALIKATSWAGELAPALLSRPSRPRALMMTVTPEAYLAGVLVSPPATGDVRVSATTAMARLHRRLGAEPFTLHRMSLGERTAMVWVCEMLALRAAADAHPEQAHWIDFDSFLAAPEPGLAAALNHLGKSAEPAAIRAVIQGPLMSRYAKGGHPFDAAKRRALLTSSRQANREEIFKGLAWLEDAAGRFPTIGALAQASSSMSQ
jgi:hypothetical protein